MAVRTFSFVDLAGYSAASWVHGDDVAARLSIRLHDLAEGVAAADDVVIKSIGDAVMCKSEDPSDALEWLARLFKVSEAEHHFPRLRAGSHHGEAVEHRGDYYGTAVNIAARVAALAQPCELLVTDSVNAATRQLGWPTESRGMVSLRNIAGPIHVHSVSLPGVTVAPTIDPVCRMRVHPESAAASADYAGQQYWFCSSECHEAFLAKPAEHLPPSSVGDPSG